MKNYLEPILTHDFREISESFSRLHPVAITDPESIRRLLEQILRDRIELNRGMNRKILPEIAEIQSIDRNSLLLRTNNFAGDARHRIFLNFAIDSTPYFFSSMFVEKCEPNTVRIEIPAVIYQSERRDRHRSAPREGESRWVAVCADENSEEHCEIVDATTQGLGLEITRRTGEALGSYCKVRYLDGDRKGQVLFGEVRRLVEIPNKAGLVRVGLDVSSTKRSTGLAINSLDSENSADRLFTLNQRWRIFSAAAKLASRKAIEKLARIPPKLPDIRVVEFFNDENEHISAIIDSTGNTHGAPAVIIPPAWGKTKESLMPLSQTILSSFSNAGVPLSVVRFDGIRKRGESHNESKCNPGRSDHHRFTFSQGVRDIRTTIDFLESTPEFRPEKIVVVSFSAAAIETRRAVADDSRIDGWVSIVGASDLQSMMRVISGGIDFASGLEKGISFGMQEILGIEVDMDHAGLDAFRNNLVYLDDSRRDMGRITVPVTWIHGRYDAWMSKDRALDALSRGSIHNRKFVEVPTGHMLRTSREALETFQLVTREVSRMVLGYELKPTMPNLQDMENRGIAERGRLSREKITLHQFWRDYLLGRETDIGIELMTSIAPYKELMRIQARDLRLSGGDIVVDLGAGTGSFPQFAASNIIAEGAFRVIEVDFVREGFLRTRKRLLESNVAVPFDLQFLQSDLDLSDSEGCIPLVSSSVDAVIASLFISYVRNPEFVLNEVFRVLKPRGRLVISSLRRDADMSKLYIEGINELRTGLARERFGMSGEKEIETAARSYLNQASKLLDLEEEGEFRFWEINELVEVVKAAGFRQVESKRSMGSPPQAIVVSAIR